MKRVYYFVTTQGNDGILETKEREIEDTRLDNYRIKLPKGIFVNKRI